MAKGTNLGVEKKSTQIEIENEEGTEQDLRDEEIEVPIKEEDKKGWSADPETDIVKFKGYTPVDFPAIENENISLYECFVPTKNTDKDGKTYIDYLRNHEGTYELRMFGQVWRWKAADYEREEKVIFRKTIAYLLRSGKSSNQFLFVPKTNQLFPIF